MFSMCAGIFIYLLLLPPMHTLIHTRPLSSNQSEHLLKFDFQCQAMPSKETDLAVTQNQERKEIVPKKQTNKFLAQWKRVSVPCIQVILFWILGKGGK